MTENVEVVYKVVAFDNTGGPYSPVAQDHPPGAGIILNRDKSVSADARAAFWAEFCFPRVKYAVGEWTETPSWLGGLYAFSARAPAEDAAQLWTRCLNARAQELGVYCALYAAHARNMRAARPWRCHSDIVLMRRSTRPRGLNEWRVCAAAANPDWVECDAIKLTRQLAVYRGDYLGFSQPQYITLESPAV